MATAAAPKEEAAATLAVAETAEASAREQAAVLDTQQARLGAEPATAQAELQTLLVTPAGSDSASAAQTAIDAATACRGTRYAWGGGGTKGPGWGWGIDLGVWGFDCSGLTQYAYAQAGISIPRNSRRQYSALPKVTSDDLRPGDLVFWAKDTSNPDTIHPVAIWLGGDSIIEAPQSGSVVKVSDMRWRGYIGAVRPTA